MRHLRMCVAASALCLVFVTPTLQSREALRVRVTPPVTVAPGFVTVQVMVEPSPDNRRLEVIAESAEYYRRSEVLLDGERAARLSVFELKDLPSGMYEVTTVLVGTDGQRAAATNLARVATSPGR